MAGSFNTDEEMIAGINVTPLVDVVLVLLIIFLITAPILYQSAIKVQLPKASTGEQAEKTALKFTLSATGDLHWNDERIDWDELGKRLAAAGPGLAQQSAVVSADENTHHGTVIRLMDALRQAGLTRFALNVESPAPPSH